MSSSAEAPRDAVVRIIIELERSCLDADAALVERRWGAMNAALAHQGDLTLRLAGLFESSPEVAPDRDERVAARLRGILRYRDDQLQRTESYRDEVGHRLRGIGQLRALSRTVGRHDRAAALLDGQY